MSEPTTDRANLQWHVSKFSGGNECVAVAKLGTGQVAMRHSKAMNGAELVYTKAEMQAFIAGVKDGEFDYLVG